jgi:cytochrome c oxidase subunit I+III
MNEPGALDVRDLPSIAFGSRAPLWWGIVLLIVIESMGFLLLLGSYLYLRGNSQVWPPEGIRTSEMVYPVIGTALLLASVPPTHWLNRAALREDLPGVRRWMAIATLPAIAFCVLRALEFAKLPFTWYDHAYGSLFWTLLGMHSLHAVTGVLENLFTLFLLIRGPVEKKHLPDIRAGGLYWYFMVFSWVPLFALLYGERWL